MESKKSFLPWILVSAVFFAIGSCSLVSYLSFDRAFSFFESFDGPRKKHTPSEKDYIAQLEISGVIMGNREDIFDALEDIEEKVADGNVKGLLLHINSPGGSVAPTQDLYRRVNDLKKKIPVVCALGDVAASGGYYLASVCNQIYALPGTTTGSIGVIFQLFNVENLVSWAKIKPVTIKAGKLKDVGSPFRQMTDAELAYLQNMLNEVHEQFIRDVLAMRGKKIKNEVLRENADGRILTGEQAIKIGLVDKVGGVKDAQLWLKNDRKLGDLKVIRFPKPRRSLEALFTKTQNLPLDAQLSKWGIDQMRSFHGLVPMLLPTYFLAE